MFEHAFRNDFDVVYGRYEFRKHSAFRRAGSWFNDLAAGYVLEAARHPSVKLQSHEPDGRRRAVKYDGKFPYLNGMIFRITQNVDEMGVSHLPAAGRSGYNLRKLISLWMNMFLGFSTLPLRAVLVVGGAMSAIGDAGPCGYSRESLQRPFVRELALADGVHRRFCRRADIMLAMLGEYTGRSYLECNGTPQYMGCVTRKVRRRGRPAARQRRFFRSRLRRGRSIKQSGRRAMSPAEIELMASVEVEHWWYRGLRNALGHTLTGPRGGMPARARILDAGCGTGENLRFVKDLLNPSYAVHFYLSPWWSIHRLAKVPGADVYQSDIRYPKIRATTWTLS